MTESLFALLYFALLTGVCYGVGRFIVSARAFPVFAERFLFAAPSGMGVLSLVLLALGVCRLFYAPVFYAILALGVPGWWLWWRDHAAAPKPDAVPTAPKESGLINLGFTATFVILAFCTLVAALAPPGGGEWDTMSYHLTVPKTYLMAHRVFYIPYDHHSNFPFLLQMLYSLMLGVGSVGGAKLCHWGCGVLLVLSVYTFARRMDATATGHRTGLIAALLVAASPVVLWEAGIAYVDLATALFTWLALYALTIGRDRTILAALLIGFAIGTKWTVLGFWGILLLGIVATDLMREKRISADLVKRIAVFAFVSLALSTPWLLRSYLYTGSPVYPYFYSVFGGRFWTEENAAQYTIDQANLGMGKNPLYLLLAPWLLNVEPTARKFNEYPFGFALAIVPLLLSAPFLPRKRNGTQIALAAFAFVAYLFWFALVQGTRYLLPVLPVLALLAAQTLMGLFAERKGFARYVGTGIVALSGVWGMYLAANAFTAPAIRVVLGTQSRAEYVAQTQWMDTLYPASAWINDNTPPNAKVALFDVVFGFYIDRPILWANPNHSGTLLPWDTYQTADDWLTDFKRRGYTYILTDDATTALIRSDSSAMNQAWRTFLPEAVAAGKVEVVFEKANAGGLAARVYRIR
ncbi:MAG: hypothetical protein H7Y38_09940, partial [Armatimonadetes bacterium]|nr:hypothetical protein [Armatimonadota bacterium]